MSDDRRYPVRPVLGVGALIFEGDSILLVERGKPPLQGQWSLPGGGVETGELIETALRREVLEETGLLVEPVRLATIFERIMPDESGRTEYHYVLIDWVCRVTGGELRPASDVADARWFRPDSLSSVPLTSGTLSVIQSAWPT